MAHFPPIRSSTSRDGQFRIEGSDWRAANEAMASVPGLRNKTWLSGAGAHSIGGFYEFDSETDARVYCRRPADGFRKGRQCEPDESAAHDHRSLH
jgi:Putative mono-oxygenase ydhR